MTREEEARESIKCFEKTVNQITDLLIDAYKWKKLARCTEDTATREKYEHLSETLHSLYVEQHEHILNKYKAA